MSVKRICDICGKEALPELQSVINLIIDDEENIAEYDFCSVECKERILKMTEKLVTLHTTMCADLTTFVIDEEEFVAYAIFDAVKEYMYKHWHDEGVLQAGQSKVVTALNKKTAEISKVSVYSENELTISFILED